MNKIFLIVGLALAIALLGNRKGFENFPDSGEAIERVGIFWKIKDNIYIPYITIPEKAWYKDSIGITQVCGIFTEETDTSRITAIKTMGFRFVDLKRKWVYEYANFADTAAVKRKYRYTDTTLFPGGWNFANRTPLGANTLHYLSDTTIDGINFKRRKIDFSFNATQLEAIGLFRCDKKNTHFQIDTAISNKIGCPLVFCLRYPVNSPNGRFSSEIKYISDHLPDSVLKVFAAWKRNEILYPIQ